MLLFCSCIFLELGLGVCLELDLDCSWTVVSWSFGPRCCQSLFICSSLLGVPCGLPMQSLWLGLLVWCVVMLHLIYAEVKHQRTNTGQNVEKGINACGQPSSTTISRRPTRSTASQTEWGNLEFHIAHQGRALHREDCQYLGRGSRIFHLCQIWP